MPLDDLIKKDNVDTSVYVPSLMNLVGKVSGVTYMLPFYNYSMGIIYRKDLLNDPKEQADFKAKYGIDLADARDLGRIPQAGRILHARHRWRRQSSISTAPSTRASAATASACSGRTISMPTAASITTPTGRRPSTAKPASRRWKTSRTTSPSTGRPARRASASTRPIASSARARPTASSPSTSCSPVSTIRPLRQVVGKADIAPNPVGGLNGGWGWAIPNSSQDKDAAWKFIKWVESKDIVKKRTLAGGAPTQAWVFDDPDVVAKRPYMDKLKTLVATAQEFPTFTYTVDFVEVLGPRAQSGGHRPEGRQGSARPRGRGIQQAGQEGRLVERVNPEQGGGAVSRSRPSRVGRIDDRRRHPSTTSIRQRPPVRLAA